MSSALSAVMRSRAATRSSAVWSAWKGRKGRNLWDLLTAEPPEALASDSRGGRRRLLFGYQAKACVNVGKSLEFRPTFCDRDHL